MRWLALASLLCGCAELPGGPPRPPATRIDEAGCHLTIFDHPPQQPATTLGRISVAVDVRLVDEDWVRRSLAGQACVRGADALVLAGVEAMVVADHAGEPRNFVAEAIRIQR